MSLATVPIQEPQQELPPPAQTPSRRRQVLQVLFRLALLAAPFAAFLICFEYRFHRLTPSHLAVKKALLERQAPRTEILVLGSSHELTGIEPAELGRPAFNMANQSQSLYYDLGLLGKYRGALSGLKLVILPISYFSLEYELEKGPEQWRSFHYRYFYSLPHQDWHRILSTRNHSAYFLSSESFRAKVLFGTALNASLEFDSWGGWTNRPAEHTSTIVDTNALNRAALGTLRMHEAMMKPEHIQANLARLEQAITRLRAEQVEVVLVTLPVTRFYSSRVQREKYDRMQANVAQLSQKHGIRYLNHMFDDRFQDADFADGDHLNIQGAKKFTQLLRQELANTRPQQPIPK